MEISSPDQRAADLSMCAAEAFQGPGPPHSGGSDRRLRKFAAVRDRPARPLSIASDGGCNLRPVAVTRFANFVKNDYRTSVRSLRRGPGNPA